MFPTDPSHLPARNAELLAALDRVGVVPDLRRQVFAAVGALDAAAFSAIPVLGFHVAVGPEIVAVYLVTDRVFALFEANVYGRTYTLTVSLGRVRRVGRLEDAEFTRLIVELEADRATSTASVTADGRSEGQIIPAGYELVEGTPTGRESLRVFQVALSASLSL